QPVAAPYATAATPTRPPFNVQVKSAHPAPHFPPSAPQYGGLAPQPAPPMGPYVPTPPRAPDYGYVPPPAMGYGSAPPPSATQRGWEGAEPSYGPPGSAWKPEPAYPPAVGQYPSSGARKSHGYEPVPAPQLPALQPKNTLEQCSVCAKPIMERILRATGKAYHPHCFTCVICSRSLDGIPFTVDAGGNIHCIEDFHRWEPIMPAQGQEETVRIVALDRDFHVLCYRCEDCGGLLSEGDNQGCYPLDGHILCKGCNSARIQALTAKASTDL
ncbi:Lipoma-preferred partner-like protein, partial [Ophiophagus hannah]